MAVMKMRLKRLCFAPVLLLAVLASGPALAVVTGQYLFENNLLDTSPNARHGTGVAAPTFVSPGLYPGSNFALQLNTNGLLMPNQTAAQAVSLPANTQFVTNATGATLMAWVRLDGGTMTVPARPRPIRLGRRGMNAALLAAAAAALTVVVAAMLLWPRSDPQEIALWESVRDSENPLELRAYLDHYPKGAFAEPARSRFERVAPAWIARAVSEGREAEARRDFKTAHARYRVAADLGEPAALHSICYFTWQGRGTQFDPVAAQEA